MALSAFDLYSVGIGPSSSHTVGPMRAAKRFADGLAESGRLGDVRRIRAELFGSLGATGHGHGSPKAVVLGLEGEDPATTDTDRAAGRLDEIRAAGSLLLAGTTTVPFDVDDDLVMHRRRSLPAHPNGMTFAAYDADDAEISFRTYYSVGGGFVVDEAATGADRVVVDETPLRYPFTTGAELLAICEREGLPVSQVMLANEAAWRTEPEIREGMLHLWSVMAECVQSGYHREGVLPGGLRVPRRAPAPLPRPDGPGVRRPAARHGLGQPLCARRERGERLGRPRRHRADQRRRGDHPRRTALLREVRPRRRRRRHRALSAHRRRRRHPVQDQRLDLRCRGRLPGRGRIGVLDGRRRARRGARRQPGPGRERRGDRHRAQPRAHLRPRRRAGPDPVHRAQRDRRRSRRSTRPASPSTATAPTRSASTR